MQPANKVAAVAVQRKPAGGAAFRREARDMRNKATTTVARQHLFPCRHGTDRASITFAREHLSAFVNTASR
jgi:hypothetical protein